MSVIKSLYPGNPASLWGWPHCCPTGHSQERKVEEDSTPQPGNHGERPQATARWGGTAHPQGHWVDILVVNAMEAQEKEPAPTPNPLQLRPLPPHHLNFRQAPCPGQTPQAL